MRNKKTGCPGLEGEGRFGDRDAETQAHRDEGQVKTEAEPGVMLPKPRNARIFSKHQKL